MRHFGRTRPAILMTGFGLLIGAMVQGAVVQGAVAQGTAAPSSAAAAEASPPAVTRPASRHRATAATPEQMRQSMERYLTQLRTQLGVKSALQPQWDAFAQLTRGNANELQDRFTQRGANLGRMSAAENMAEYAQISELHSQQLLRLATAFRALYDAMTPDQKRGADAVFRVNHSGRAAQ